MNKAMIAIASVLMVVVLMVAIAKADGFGEYSGFLIYNISINSTHTEAWTLINSYNYSLKFSITPPNLTINSSNVTPTLTFSTLNGTIAPDSNYQVNVTVFIPPGATTNTFWQGYATAFAVSASNQSNASAKIQIGTAKLIQITAEPEVIKKAKTTSTASTTVTSSAATTSIAAAASSPGIGDSTLIIIVLAIALIAVIAYILGGKRRSSDSDKKKK